MRVAVLACIAGLAAAAVGYALGTFAATPLFRSAVRLGGGAALALRLLPSAGALLAAGALIVPGFVVHEPARADERVGRIALMLASAGLLLLGSVARRWWRAWRATRAVLAEWNRTAQPAALINGPAPAFRIDHPFPVVAAVGAFRPRLYLARSVLEVLTPSELSAVLEHEAAHLGARDNVKRWLMACAPSIGWRRAALRLERAWEEAAEQEADRGSHGALELASALVKTARLAPRAPQLRMPVAVFHDAGDVARRIQVLIAAPRPEPAGLRGLCTALIVAAAAATAALPLAWSLAHRWAETLIHLP